MDTDALKAFIEIARNQSFSQAAEALHLTQPAVSKRLASLEQSLNCRLFDRVGRKINLTEAGLELLPRAQSILAATNDAKRAIDDLSGQVRGELRLTTSHHMGLHYLPKYLRRYNDHYPDVKLSLDFQDSEKALEQVLSGESELAALTLASSTNAKLIEAYTWQDPLYFVVAKDHPLATKPNPQLADLSGFSAILPETNTFTTQLVIDLFAQQNQPLEIRMATNFLETIKMLVSIGLGWGLLPQTLIKDSDLHPLTMPNTQIVRRLGLIHNKNRSLSNASKAFLKLFKD